MAAPEEIRSEPTDRDDLRTTAERMARHMVLGFKYHDDRQRSEAVDAFAVTDREQFPHLDAETARDAAEAYVDALWEKDAVERSCMVDGEIDAAALDEADWSAVEAAFARRAHIVGMDERYAEASTVAWRRHKTGGDYWTPMKEAQVFELRAAMGREDYPQKPRYGQSGYGPEAVRYLLGVELHDTREWEQAFEVMVPYFERVLRAHRSEDTQAARLASD
jgi:hypothetical protein